MLGVSAPRLRFITLVLGTLLGTASIGSAQTPVPPIEIFGGYSFLPAGGDDFPRTASSGFQGSVAANVSSWFGIVGDVGAQYSSTSDLGPNFPGVSAQASVYELLAGPRFTLRRQVSPFVHFLAGRAIGRTNLRGFADSGLALGGGGGVDVAVNRRLAARFQLDALGAFTDILETNWRYGLGVVARLGG
jgi:hypothetical protein